MRNAHYALPAADARALLAAAPAVHLAALREGQPEGRPILRVLNGAVLDDAIYFHGAPVGEKTLAVGRPCVVSWEETVAQIPSYFVDPERACPATTFYRSVQVHGVLRPVADRSQKARALGALMAARQPEGGHVPITAEHPLYAKALDGLLVLAVDLADLTGKAKLGQNRSPEQLVRVLEGLWRRGEPGDARAIDLVRQANPRVPEPPFLEAPPGLRLLCAPPPALAPQAAALLAGTYWNGSFSLETLAASHVGSSAWVAAVDADGRLVATARALSDGAKRAWIYDVCVAPEQRGTGLGKRIVSSFSTIRSCGTRAGWA
jgi:nitroimidazol reductase NimA-like FMN-containing flavoprotein (pyridoxamine 5'-phosphate oxidase superfamily)